ncbi:MAG TPA: hypothetical protein EYN86_00105 [Planctomycetes bacterium]|nr:hypothetical protein [Planctomycetota bacterium]
MNSLAKSLLIKFRIQRVAQVFQAATCVAVVCYWAATVDQVNAIGTAVFVFMVCFVAAWRVARPWGGIVGSIDKASDPQAIARTCLSDSVDHEIKQQLADGAKPKVKFRPVHQLSGMVLMSAAFAVFLQWQSYSPLHLTVSQQALLSTDLVKVGVDGKPQQVQPVSTLVQKQQTNNKRAKQLTEEARQYPNMNEQSPSVNTVVGSVGYGDEALVLQRYQELLKE